MTAMQLIRAARVRLLLGRDGGSAFFATLAMRLQLVEDQTIGTMATDGKQLAFAPEFVQKLSAQELLGVLVHEVMHNALNHHVRRGVRNPELWNIACDLAINPLLQNGGFQLPACRLMPGEYPYHEFAASRSAEEYYQLLQNTGGSQLGPDPGGCGQVLDAPADRSLQREMEVEQQIALQQAIAVAQAMGGLPGGLAQLVETSNTRPVPWQDRLQQFLSQQARNDYSWLRPNRRFLAQGLYLPGLHSEELGEVILAIDTSGSINQTQLGCFLQEIESILDCFECTLIILCHDARIQSVVEWRSSDGPLQMDFPGGGGTSHLPVFEWIDEHACTPACVICFTDLETRLPKQAPNIPVLWACTSPPRYAPPFGTMIEMKTPS
ncbi:MAG: VWA-like domain-containing protein [Zavarzinella sp.]